MFIFPKYVDEEDIVERNCGVLGVSLRRRLNFTQNSVSGKKIIDGRAASEKSTDQRLKNRQTSV